MDNTSTTALFAIAIANLTPVERMPTIVNFEFCTDMGRMSGESPWVAETISSPAPTTEGAGQPSFIV
jgi:hypothetical protein